MTPYLDREQLGRLVYRTMRDAGFGAGIYEEWERTSERRREQHRRIGEAVGNAVLEAAMGVQVGGDEEKRINVQSGFGANTQQPFVTLSLPGPEPRVQLRPHEARDLALNLLEGAEAALTDGLIVEFFVRKIGMKLAEVAPLLNQLRAYRIQKSKEGA